MTTNGTTSPAPKSLAAFDIVMHRLLAAGFRIGPFALLTVSGRKSGLARTTAVSLVEAGGRRWVQATAGETEWARNLRASGTATLRVGRVRESVVARELPQEEATTFFRDVLMPRIRKVPFGSWLIGGQLQSRDILEDPEAAAKRHPVFELNQRPGLPGAQ